MTRPTALLLLAVPTLLLPARRVEAQQVDVWGRQTQVERVRAWDFIDYRIVLRLDPDRQRLDGEATIMATPLKEGLDTIEVDAEGLRILEVRAAGSGPLGFKAGEGRLTVSLPSAMAPRDTLRLTVAYDAEGSRSGFFFDRAGDGHPQMVSTDSWPNEARQWFPCWDYPHDKATQSVSITVPEGFKALSNGRFVGVTEDPSAGTVTWSWRQDRPHATYLAMIAAGPFEVVEDEHGPLPVSYWVYPGSGEASRPVFAKTPEMIGFFEDLYGVPFPWAKYAQVTTPHVGGGAEATSATILGEAVLGAAEPADRLASWQQVIAHEIAHQWWGDLVTMREWSHTWLSESFATYSDYLWTVHDRGADAGALDLEAKRRRYFTEARDRYRRPIVFDRYEKPGDNFDAHTYPKGAAVLHMLRGEVGDETFFRILNRFLVGHAFETVTTDDLLRTAEEVSGSDLHWFFDQWLFRPGHPELEVGHLWDAPNQMLVVRVTQMQESVHGTPYAYRLPVRIGITTASGKRVEQILVNERDGAFFIPLEQAPLLVRFDEGNLLLAEIEHAMSTEELRYQAVHDDVVGRRRARARLEAMGITPPPE